MAAPHYTPSGQMPEDVRAELRKRGFLRSVERALAAEPKRRGEFATASLSEPVSDEEGDGFRNDN